MPIQLAERMGRISESATMAVSAEAGRLKREGVDVIAFGAGEPDFPTPENIKNAAKEALDNNFTRYTPAGGIPELKEAIVDSHRDIFGTDYAPNECIASVGGKHTIFNVMAAVVSAGDEVVLPVPYWVTFFDVINYYGGTPVKLECQESEGFRLRAEDIEKVLTPKTRLVVVNSPNNPSGAVVGKEEFQKIVELTAKRGILLLTDECYHRLVYDSEPFSAAALEGARPNVIVVASLSKTYAMTGWRLGFCLAEKELIGAINKLQSHSTSNPTSIAQMAGIEALRGPQDSVAAMLAEYRVRRDYVVPELASIPGFTCPTPGGAFYAYPNVKALLGKGGVETSLDFAGKLLREAHVAVVPGEAFGTASHFRLSYAASMEDLKNGIARIRAFAAQLG